ncbi:MAG TPA: DUF2268 domain-containing putative Zn-dependent protease [Bacteroidales bacterium]|nr:DUF2268 domain-containing putative Zn-dependent protease [Bacteroidales bacterium]
MKRLLILINTIIISVFFYSCTCNHKNDEKNLTELKDTTVKISISRYEKSLFTLNKDDLQNELKKIKPQYSFFLDGDLSDKNNIEQIRDYLNDPHMIENYNTCQKLYPDLSRLEKQLSSALTYFKYYFPDKKIPAVFTYVCGMDFENPVIYADSVLLIALDMYLGSDYPLYQSLALPLFMRKTMSEEYIVRDCMKAMSEYYCYREMKDATCLDHMVYEGKKQYFVDAMMPEVNDTIKFKYSKKQLDWCYDNESKMWAFFIDNKLLYTKDNNAFNKFFVDAPFTTSFSKNSPPRTGIWIGWNIVSKYMKQDKNSNFTKLIQNNNSQEILSQSKYKPKKQ